VKREAFTAIPARIDKAIDQGALHPRRGEILKRLIYRCWPTGESEFTLQELADFLRNWTLTLEALRLDLIALGKPLELEGVPPWISIRSPGRGRAVWHVLLVGAALEFDRNSNSNGPEDRSAVSAATAAGSREASIPSDNVSRGPTDTDTEEDLKTSAVGRRGSRAGKDSLIGALVAELRNADGKTQATYELKFGVDSFGSGRS